MGTAEALTFTSVGYATIRIDEMRPRMLELGETLEQTDELLNIHNDLIARLKSKEDQVHELLARADHLVTEQHEPDVHVYEAMAESLAMAWKELNQQLQLRGFLLSEVYRFYSFVRKHENILTQVKQLLNQAESRQFSDAIRLQREIQQALDELTNMTLKAVESAVDVISQIRVLGSVADNLERDQETVDACLMIEKKMLSLTADYDYSEDLWKSLKPNLTASIDKSNVLFGQLEDIEQWLQTAQNAYQRGEDVNPLLQQAYQQKSILEDIISTSTKESCASHLMDHMISLQSNLENFIHILESKQDEIRDVNAFITKANSMLHQLNSMENDVRNANAAMAGELGPLARQKVEKIVEEGRRIEHLDQRIPQLIYDIEQKLNVVENLAKERIDSSQQKYSKELDTFERWLVENAENFITTKTKMGKNLTEASAFCSTHKDFITEVINKDTEFNALLNHSHESSENDRRRLGELASRYEFLKRLLEGRAQLGSAFYQVHKFARDLEASFESLDALLSSNRNFSSEKLTTQMSEVFRMIQETLNQERHQGGAEKFISAANTVGVSDEHLDIKQASNSVRELLAEHEKRFENITESWKEWQENRSQQKSVIRVVEEIQMWQEETLEKIRILEERFSGPVMIQEKDEMKRKMNEVIRSIPIQREKIQKAEDVIRSSENEEAVQKFKTVKQRLDEIDQKLNSLKVKIETVVEEVRETREVHQPKVITPLRDAKILEGNRYELVARVDAEPPMQIQWLKDGIDIKDNIDYRTSFVNGLATLTIEETFVEDTAVYTLRVQNPSGVTETSAKLIVNSQSEMSSQIEEITKPRFIRQLHNVTGNEGEGVVMDCVVVGNPEPKVVWYKEEETIKESERIVLKFVGNHCSLSISDAVSSDSGMYTVRASNSVGDATNFCRLTIHPKGYHIPPPTPPKPIRMHPPSFSPSLDNQILLQGQSAVFQVKVAGEPVPDVHWTYNDKPLITSASLRVEAENNGWHRVIIDGVQPKHSGMYTVIAENAAGEAKSGASLLVRSSALPAIQREIITDSNTINDGFWSDSALLSSPTPPPIPKHRYHTESSELIETRKQTDFELSEYSTTATAPEFIRPFQNEYTVNEGEKFKMECTMVGNPRPKVSWYFNDRPLNVNTTFCQISNYGDSYAVIFNPARLENAGYYKMVAENIRGKTESLTVVHVRPESLQQRSTPKSLTKQHIQVTEEFGEYEYEEQIPTYSETKITQEAYEEEYRNGFKHTSRLPTPPPAKKQQLVTTTHERKEKLSETYQVEKSKRSSGRPPHFTQTLVSSVATSGDSAKFEGIVTGDPSPEVQWIKDSVVLSRAVDPTLSFSNIGGRVSLTINSARPEHEGKYMCTAKNIYGVATSSAQLVVRPKTVAPDFIRRLISEEVVEGEQLKWSVKVTGDPAPKVVWLRDGQEIPNCEEVQLINEGDGVHSMIIKKVELADCGQFTCLAENVAGEARSTADLVVRRQGTEPGSYFHVTKVTQEKQVKGEDYKQTVNQTFAIENPKGSTN
uniref:PH domain-containing protein n=1 Tax=Syphacia muris TaxID=451379 RepID=A0A158R5E4_9BILA